MTSEHPVPSGELRIRGEVDVGEGSSYAYEASWYVHGDEAVWDAVLTSQTKSRSMVGGRVMLADSLPNARERIEAFIRDAVAYHARLLTRGSGRV